MYFEGRADRIALWIVCWESRWGEMQLSRMTTRFLTQQLMNDRDKEQQIWGQARGRNQDFYSHGQIKIFSLNMQKKEKIECNHLVDRKKI